MTNKKFRKIIWKYYRAHGRDLPWRKTKNPYKTFISEIMLQQTQVSRVLTKYPEFIKKFRSFRTLANAPFRDVMRVWQGMGHNKRALYLKQSAKIIVNKYTGRIPNDPKLLEQLPGVGKATAASVVTFVFNEPAIFIETNIRRAFIYHFFANGRPTSILDAEIFPLIERTLERKNPREWYWALMDYGSMLGKTLPKLKVNNPNHKSAHYKKQSKFEGSRRQLRGKIIKLLLEKPRVFSEIFKHIAGVSKNSVCKSIKALIRDKLIKKQDGKYMVG